MEVVIYQWKIKGKHQQLAWILNKVQRTVGNKCDKAFPPSYSLRPKRAQEFRMRSDFLFMSSKHHQGITPCLNILQHSLGSCSPAIAKLLSNHLHKLKENSTGSISKCYFVCPSISIGTAQLCDSPLASPSTSTLCPVLDSLSRATCCLLKSVHPCIQTPSTYYH